MEIRQLRYFVTVAQTRHFGQAAERLHMAQSPLSQAIRQLESQVGATLFHRTTRRVDLTAAGEAFLRDAQRILASVETAQERVRRIGDGHSGLLRVGSTGLAAYTQLPQLARIAARELPDLILRYVPDLLTPEQETALAEDRIDVAVLRPPLRRPGLGSRVIGRERFVLAVAQHHRLAGDDPVALAELSGEDFVGYGTPDSVVNAAVAQACLAAGFLPRRAHEAAETSIMLTLVAAGLGVALLPESARTLRVDGVRFVSVADDAHVDLALAWRLDDVNPALARLIEVLEANGFVPPPATSPWPQHAYPGAVR
ncbi:LysR family transcriptional regulator [Pseudonocardia nigra]|uniref:LysR family transcriptional regulator n=1 Tax=Pseudonocardia nigra TaxID=1921578 RepID=UPI001C5D4D02|nr:LysR substrate-binding domain-containing protein [Pseudonocardia nigra]